MTKARTIRHGGETWVSEADIIRALKDDGMIVRAAAMMKVSKIENHDTAIHAIRMGLACFFAEATGAIAHEFN